jgi:DNA-binding transcriptional ArsR family regulator
MRRRGAALHHQRMTMTSENNPTDTDSSDPTSAQLNRVFTALKDPLRRKTLRELTDREKDTISVGALCRTFREESQAFEGTEYEGWEIESLRMELINTHLPYLEDRGVIEYDARSEMIRYRNHSTVETVLETINDQ